MDETKLELQRIRQAKYKQKIKERIRLSNEAEQKGLPPDPWVVSFREKNNLTKASWKAKQPKKEPKKKTANAGSFKKGSIPGHKLSPEEKAKSILKWKINTREWHKVNRERVNNYSKEKKRNDPAFRILCNLRKRLSTLLRLSLTKKTEQTMGLLGCTLPEFIRYLSQQFKPGMTLENYGEWHIDHIKPCYVFDLTKIEDRKECFHFTNLQPLWGVENRIKSNKFSV